MTRAIRAWVPFGITALLIVGIPLGVVIGARLYQVSGIIETPIQPQLAREGTDPRTLSVGVEWLESGWCLGDFQARAIETASKVRVSMIHRQFKHGGNCAGVGTTYNTAWADLELSSPLGNRSVVRSSDSSQLPVLTRNDRFLRKHPVAADIRQFGGLNDRPPLALKKEARVSDPALLERLATQLDSLPPFPSGAILCPNDDGSYYLVELDYVVGGDTSLKINARGCNGVYINGVNKAAASALSGPVNIFPLLDSLLGD